MPAVIRTRLTLVALAAVGVTMSLRTRKKDNERTTRSVPEAIAPYGEEGIALPVEPQAQPAPEPEPKPKPKGKLRRRLGKILIALGIVLAAYSAAIVFWGDPATYLYAHWKQNQLSGELNREFADYAASAGANALAVERSRGATPLEIAQAQRELVERAANRLNHNLRMSQPLGRIKIPRIGVNAIFVQGTRWGPDLSKGPGHYPQTSLPGVGRTMGIAAHRTTFGAWFRNINSLDAGDKISSDSRTGRSTTRSSSTRSSRAATGASSGIAASTRSCSPRATRSTAPHIAGSSTRPSSGSTRCTGSRTWSTGATKSGR